MRSPRPSLMSEIQIALEAQNEGLREALEAVLHEYDFVVGDLNRYRSLDDRDPVDEAPAVLKARETLKAAGGG